jgi:hypothetical protein
MTDTTTTPTDSCSASVSPSASCGTQQAGGGLSLQERVDRLEHLANLLTTHTSHMHGALVQLLHQRSVDAADHIRAADDPESALDLYVENVRKSAASLTPPADGDPTIRALVVAGITGALSDHISVVRGLALQQQRGQLLQS